jgi:predicted transcriptional regulator
MRTSKLDLPHIKLLIAHAMANGQSQRQIAQELNTSQPAISRFAIRGDVHKLIRKEEKRIYLQVTKELQKIRNDPRFLAELHRSLEKELLKYIWRR